MYRTLRGSSRHAQCIVGLLQGLISRLKFFEFSGVKIHYSSDSVAPRNYRSGAVQYLRFIECKWVYRYYILNITPSENGIVHADAVYSYEHSVGCKASDHGASTPQLTFLYKNCSRVLQ